MHVYGRPYRPYQRPSQPKHFFRLNFNITAPQVRVLNEEGKQIGIFTREEALRRAREADADLVEIAPQAKPPVCKIIDFKKFKYQESKRERELRKKAKEVVLKEIRLSPFIGQHDFQIRVDRAKEFLHEGDRIKIVIQFHGREITRKEFGYDLARKFAEAVGDIGTQDQPSKMEGKSLVAYFSKGKGSKYAKDENKESSVKAVQANQNG